MNLDAIASFRDKSPWPDSARRVVFLLDAANPFERRVLLRWIDHHKPDDVDFSSVTLYLSNDKGLPPTHHLAKNLTKADDAVVVPLRLSWLPSREVMAPSFGLRDWLRRRNRRPLRPFVKHTLRKHPECVSFTVAQPADLGELRTRFREKYPAKNPSEGNELAIFVARQAAVVLDIAERQLTGGRYKVPRYVAESLRRNPEFKARLKAIAEQEQRPRESVYKEVNSYFDEMVSVPTPFWLDVYAKFANFCLRLGYDTRLNYRQDDLERIREIVRNHPSALLWTHKTYLDGFVVPKIMFENDFPMPHMFGGANLNFPGLGFLLRRAGGIFIKRSFQDNEVYKASLRQYIGYLMEKRFPLTWSFEGTRSRLGKLMPPKYGLLKYVLEGCYNSGAKDIHIIPVTVTYDLIRDAEEYAREQSGVPKAPESLSWLIGYIRSLARPMGKIYVDFGDPVVLAQAPDPKDSLALSKIAFEVAVQANRVTPITFPAIVSMSLLGVYPRALTEAEIISEVSTLISWAEERDLRLSPDFDRSYAENMDDLLGIMIEEGIITRFDGGPEVVYGICDGQAAVASYYRNTIVHYFVNRAIIELATLAAAEDRNGDALSRFWEEVDQLRDSFKFEFFYPKTEAFHQDIATELDRTNPDWQTLLQEGPSGATRLFRRLRPFVGHKTLQMFAEAYSVAADVLAKHKEEILEKEDCIQRCMSYGKQAYLQRRITSEASVGKLLFQNAYQLLAARHLTDASQPDFLGKRQHQADQFATLVRRIEVIRATEIATRGASTTRDKVRGSI